jgi:hypothetical protein
MQSVDGAGCDLAQPSLHFRPGELDRVEVRRVILIALNIDLCAPSLGGRWR